MKRVALLLVLAAPPACVGTSLEVDRHDPGNPNAPTLAIPDAPPTLRSGFDPGAAAASAPAPAQHDHSQHDHSQHDHSQHGAPADGGTR